jgi:hypothetical protein
MLLLLRLFQRPTTVPARSEDPLHTGFR